MFQLSTVISNFLLVIVLHCSLLGILSSWNILNEFQKYFSYSVPSPEDIYAAVILVCVNFVCNILLVCGVNKDYSGRLEILKDETKY